MSGIATRWETYPGQRGRSGGYSQPRNRAVAAAARTRRFPGIAFRGDDPRRRAWVIGSGLDVWEIIQMLQDFGSREALLADSHVTAPQLRIAQAYREGYPDEIDGAIAQNRASIDDIDVLYPFIEVAD